MLVGGKYYSISFTFDSHGGEYFNGALSIPSFHTAWTHNRHFRIDFSGIATRPEQSFILLHYLLFESRPGSYTMIAA